MVLLLGTIVLFWFSCFCNGRPLVTPGDGGTAKASAEGGPRTELESEGRRIRLWPLGGYMLPLAGVPIRFIGPPPRIDMALPFLETSPLTNCGNLRSSS